MAISIWSGTISFGLVAIPVRLAPAVRPRRTALRLLHSADNATLVRRMFCPAENKVVLPEHIVRGAEVGSGTHVVVRDEDLDRLEPERRRSIEITEFVPADAIDPVYYDRPYYLQPEENAVKAYRLLAAALEETGKAGLAEFILRDRERLAAVRGIDGVLVLFTLHFQDSIVPPDEFAPSVEPESDVVQRMLEAARKMSAPFNPSRLTDRREEQVLALVKAKMKKQGAVTAPATDDAGAELESDDLAAVLEKSAGQERRKR